MSALLVGIPGGPCFSSETFKALKPELEIELIDPPARGSFGEALDDIERKIARLGTGPFILIGHSFGGIQASEIALRAKIAVAGLVCVAAPLSPRSFEIAGSQHAKHSTPELEAAGREFERSPSDESFLRWNLAFGPLYFAPANIGRGAELLRRDRTSFQAYLEAGATYVSPPDLLARIRALPLKKLYLAAELDLMFPPADMKPDASSGGFEFEVIPGSGHFAPFEAPAAVAEAIRRRFPSHS